jgi:SagB-type dehydrogenase family enzyme
LYWRGSRLVVHNYATGRRVAAAPSLCLLLDHCAAWKTREEVVAALGLPARLVTRLLGRLVARTVLERSDSPDPRARAMTALDPWNPEAGLFHTATKDVRFWPGPEAARLVRLQASRVPMPAPVKRYHGASVIDLPRPAGGSFADVLLARRTWRRFSRATPLALGDLATLLGLSAGVQQWVQSSPKKLPLKTSPSGGARHPIECYVVARRVQGLRPGIYHYAADRHALERVRGGVTLERVASYYPTSGYFAKAPAHVLLTAVFARQLWRYPYSRAYRAALAEAGHVCQTFCLTATWLGLAPFCLMGLADSRIEHDLGIDGITESVIYAAGVGHPPAGSSWAPLARGSLKARRNPRL